MAERVFVSAASVKCPGVGGIADLSELIEGGRRAPLEPFPVAGDEILLGEDVVVDRDSAFYPTRSNEKVMRKEVLAAAVGVCELLEAVHITAAARSDIPLFVASGLTMERQSGDLDWFSRAYRAAEECASSQERNRRLSQLTPPLLALRTLTNAAASFIAEQSGVAGDNTTFGNTSLSGFYALKEGFDAVRGGRCAMALVGGASRGGMASYFMYRNFFPDTREWRESIASAFLLLESETSLAARGAGPLCELVLLRGGGVPPVLTGTDRSTPFAPFGGYGESASLAVYSGAFCRSESERLRAAAARSWPRAESLFDSLGNGGTANVFLAILAGVALADGPATVDCLDRDPYARECLVRVAAVPQ